MPAGWEIIKILSDVTKFEKSYRSFDGLPGFLDTCIVSIKEEGKRYGR
jgi:hypothetical protein